METFFTKPLAAITGVMLLIGAADAAPLIVTNTADSGAGSLRQAIGASPAGGSIAFNLPTSDPGYDPSSEFFTITLTSGELAIGRDLTITGPATAKIAISGNHVSRVFNIVAGSVSVSNLTIFNGLIIGTPGTPGTMPNPNAGPGGVGEGGGILNGGTLTLTECNIISNNAAGGDGGSAPVQGGVGGAGGSGRGGAISNSGSLTLARCSFVANHVGGGAGGNAGAFGGTGGAATGGVIYNSGSLSLIQTTISDGGASGGQGGTGAPLGGSGGSGKGGGIYNAGALTIMSSTMASCVATGKDGGKAPGTGGNGGAASGGNLFQVNGAGFSTPRSVIIALGGVIAGLGAPAQSGGNPGLNGTATEPDVAGAVSSQGHNLIGRTDGSSGWSASDLLGGTTAATAIDPLLGPIQDNGGPTFTRRPMPDSAAINNGDDSILGPPLNLATDQRGLPRKVGSHVDIGAVEVGLPQTGPTFIVTYLSNRDDGTCSNDECTLLEALNASNSTAGANIINFAAGVTGTLRPPTFGFGITDSVTINGPGARSLAIDAGGLGRLFYIIAGNVAISGLSMINGKAIGGDGGAIFNSGNLTLTNCAVVNSTATFDTFGGAGGGVENALGASLIVNGCTFTQNAAERTGGGIHNAGTLTVTNSTFSQDSAIQGGGIYSEFANNASKVSLLNCTITRCSANDPGTATGAGGGGLYFVGNSGQYDSGNTLIAGNTAVTNPDLRGNFTSDGHNFIGNVGFSSGWADGMNGDQIGGGTLPVKDPKLDPVPKNNGGPTDTHALLTNSTAINAGGDSLAPATDQRGYYRAGTSDIGAFEFNGLMPASLANISTRLRVETGDNALIGGFIVTGTQAKRVIILATGPSLPLTDKLANPTLELYQDNTLLQSNDNWGDSANKQAIIDSGVVPSDSLESAIIATLPAFNGQYTAVVRGANNTTGIGVVQAFDLERSANSTLANISTRGLVQAGDNVLIAGTIVVGQAAQKVIIRALGPSVPVSGPLADPTLELRDSNGALIEMNDNWVDSPNKQAIIDSTIPPPNNFEPAIVRLLSPAAYTAIVRGENNSTGIAVVEVYALQ